MFVMIILLLAAVGVSIAVFLITKSSETEEFENQYEGAAEEIVESFEGIIEKVGTISSIGVEAISHGMDRPDVRWPFITLSSFQQRLSTARILSGALYVTISPLVSDGERYEWEKYVVGEQSDWMYVFSIR
jgi:hypothetical protein